MILIVPTASVFWQLLKMNQSLLFKAPCRCKKRLFYENRKRGHWNAIFRESVIRNDELSAQNDEPFQSFSYNFAIPDSYGGGTLCRENWLWIYDISDHKSRKFVKRLKDSLNNVDPMSKFESFKDNLTEFSDKTYLGLPYGEVKALFEETLGFAGFNRH